MQPFLPTSPGRMSTNHRKDLAGARASVVGLGSLQFPGLGRIWDLFPGRSFESITRSRSNRFETNANRIKNPMTLAVIGFLIIPRFQCLEFVGTDAGQAVL